MLVKYLHERKEVNYSLSENNRPSTLTLEYYVLEEESGGIAGMDSKDRVDIGARYGVMVVMNDNHASTESRSLRDVTYCEAEARDYARILADHYVTPCGMLDVMEDLVADAASL